MIYAEERYNNIMRLLTEKGRISSAELSSALNISRETIRQIYSGEGYHFSGQQFYCYAFDTLHPQAVSAEPSGLLHSSAADALEHAQS